MHPRVYAKPESELTLRLKQRNQLLQESRLAGARGELSAARSLKLEVRQLDTTIDTLRRIIRSARSLQ